MDHRIKLLIFTEKPSGTRIRKAKVSAVSIAITLMSMASAWAAELPVSSSVIYCAGALDVSDQGVGGEDFSCEAVAPSTGSGAVLLLCDHSEPEFGAPWLLPARIIENIAEKTLSFADEDGTIELTPCP